MIELPQDLMRLLRDKRAAKILGTVDENGIPHVVFKDSLTFREDGTIAYAEELDSSQANKNMVRSIWFDKVVSIAVRKGKQSYQIKARPLKCSIAGPLFNEYLKRAEEQRGPEADIQSVWILSPFECRNQSREVRQKEEKEKDPYFNVHLDRLVKQTD